MVNWIKVGKLVSNTISSVMFVFGVLHTLDAPYAWGILLFGLLFSLVAPHAVSDNDKEVK